MRDQVIDHRADFRRNVVEFDAETRRSRRRFFKSAPPRNDTVEGRGAAIGHLKPYGHARAWRDLGIGLEEYATTRYVDRIRNEKR